jgi:hypothetical protein
MSGPVAGGGGNGNFFSNLFGGGKDESITQNIPGYTIVRLPGKLQMLPGDPGVTGNIFTGATGAALTPGAMVGGRHHFQFSADTPQGQQERAAVTQRIRQLQNQSTFGGGTPEVIPSAPQGWSPVAQGYPVGQPPPVMPSASGVSVAAPGVNLQWFDSNATVAQNKKNKANWELAHPGAITAGTQSETDTTATPWYDPKATPAQNKRNRDNWNLAHPDAITPDASASGNPQWFDPNATVAQNKKNKANWELAHPGSVPPNAMSQDAPWFDINASQTKNKAAYQAWLLGHPEQLEGGAQVPGMPTWYRPGMDAKTSELAGLLWSIKQHATPAAGQTQEQADARKNRPLIEKLTADFPGMDFSNIRGLGSPLSAPAAEAAPSASPVASPSKIVDEQKPSLSQTPSSPPPPSQPSPVPSAGAPYNPFITGGAIPPSQVSPAASPATPGPAPPPPPAALKGQSITDTLSGIWHGITGNPGPPTTNMWQQRRPDDLDTDMRYNPLGSEAQ